MLTQKEFDEIYNSFDFEKIELKNFELFKKGENFETKFSKILQTIKEFYTEKIKLVEIDLEKYLKNPNNNKPTIKKENILNDEIIEKYYKSGVLIDNDINKLLNKKNDELKNEKEEEDKSSIKILEEYKTHLTETMKSIDDLNKFWIDYSKRIKTKEENYKKKKEKLMALKNDNYEEYKKKCQQITDKVKDNLSRIKSMVVFDESAYKEKIKKYDEFEEKLKIKRDTYYIELKNKKEVIKKYWKFSFRTIIAGAFIGLTVPLTMGASSLASCAIGTVVGMTNSVVLENIDGLAHQINDYSFGGFTF